MTTEFTSKWLEKIPDPPRYGGNKSGKRAFVPFATSILERSQEKPGNSAAVEDLLVRLRNGASWLSRQHGAWQSDNPNAETHERFSTALEAWDLMERRLREAYGYEGCIMGPDKSCPPASPAHCDACMASDSVSHNEDVGLLAQQLHS